MAVELDVHEDARGDPEEKVNHFFRGQLGGRETPAGEGGGSCQHAPSASSYFSDFVQETFFFSF